MPPKKKPNNRPSTSSSRPGGGGKRSGRRSPPPLTVAKPKPWGLIALSLVVVLFAAAVIGYAVVKLNKSSENSPQAKADAAKSIQGIVVKDFPSRNHVTATVAYTDSPPFGGDHDPTWADCNGTVYPDPIRSENAVHMLEHGAVWITYKPGLAADQVDALKKKVDDVFGWDHLVAKAKRGETESWHGVRNYTARNNMMAMKLGDEVFFYHSNIGKEIVGIIKVVALAHPGLTAEPNDKGNIVWQCVDVAPVKKLPKPGDAGDHQEDARLDDMALVKLSRLSVARSPRRSGS